MLSPRKRSMDNTYKPMIYQPFTTKLIIIIYKALYQMFPTKRGGWLNILNQNKFYKNI